MLKFLILFAILGAALANHLGSNKWYIVTVYDGTSCQGTPIQVTARVCTRKINQILKEADVLSALKFIFLIA